MGDGIRDNNCVLFFNFSSALNFLNELREISKGSMKNINLFNARWSVNYSFNMHLKDFNIKNKND